MCKHERAGYCIGIIAFTVFLTIPAEVFCPVVCPHRYELAAAFFLLAGANHDAVSVLAKERGDPQLALLVARLVDGGAVGGPVAAKLINQVRMKLDHYRAVHITIVCACRCLQVDSVYMQIPYRPYTCQPANQLMCLLHVVF